MSICKKAKTKSLLHIATTPITNLTDSVRQECCHLACRKCSQQQDQLPMLLWQSNSCQDTLGNILNHLSFQQNLGPSSQQVKPMQTQMNLVLGTLQTHFNIQNCIIFKKMMVGSSKVGEGHIKATNCKHSLASC